MAKTKSTPLVSVILCTYSSDNYSHFKAAAESILHQTYPAVELVVVVDGTEALYNRVISDYANRDDMLTHLNPENQGLLRSRNTGAELASGDIVAFIDDDAKADPEWLVKLASAYQERDIGAVGGKMEPKWLVGEPTYLPEEFYWLVGVTHKGFPTEDGEVRNTFGSNLSFKRDRFLELNGFDAEIGGRKGDRNLQGGETELCARYAATYGEGIWYEPEAVVEHKVFEFRTEKRWLIERAFWQGYSKRAMATMVPESAAVEGDYLRNLLLQFVPNRVVGLIKRPRWSEMLEFLMIWILLISVGLGYAYGLVKWR